MSNPSISVDVIIHMIAPFLVFERSVDPQRVGSGHMLLQLRKWSPEQAANLRFKMGHVFATPMPYRSKCRRMTCHLLCRMFKRKRKCYMGIRSEVTVDEIRYFDMYCDGDSMSIDAPHPMLYDPMKGYHFVRVLAPNMRSLIEKPHPILGFHPVNGIQTPGRRQ